MSNTYRTLPKVKFCNQCNKPVYQHTVEVYELCDCPDEFVEIEVKDYKYIWNDNYPEASEECDKWQRIKTIDNGWKTEKRIKEKSTYYRYNMKAYDGDGIWYTRSNPGVRKDAQSYRNSKMRQKTHQVLKNNTLDYDEMIFPVKKNEVDWDIF